MNERDRLDRMLSAWTDDMWSPPPPAYLGEVLARTRHTRQRPAWASLERWLPMAVITRPVAAPLPLRFAWILLIALLVMALVAGGAIVGSQLLRATVAVPSGEAAVYAFGTYPGGDIHTVRADGTDLRRLTDGPGARSVPRWSPDGTRIAYRLWNAGAESVEVIDAGGGDRVTLATNAQSAEPCVMPWNLAWSPDGSSLIFPTSDRCAGDYGLSIVATNGSSPAVPLLAPGFSSLDGTWSPDGTRIAFLGQEPAGSVGVYLIDGSPADALAGGLQARRVGPDLGSSLDVAGSGPRWSPDGSELLMSRVSDGGIWAIKADGSGERLVIEDGFNPNWSPSGKQIAFHRTVDPAEYFNNRPCTVRTWIADASGANERPLDLRADGCLFEPLWSPDGTRIADELIVGATLEDPNLGFHLGIRAVDGDADAVILATDFSLGSWQPVAAPLPPAPSFGTGASGS